MKRTHVDRWVEQDQPKESEEGGGMAQWAKALAEQVYQPEFKSQDPSKRPETRGCTLVVPAPHDEMGCRGRRTTWKLMGQLTWRAWPSSRNERELALTRWKVIADS